MVAAKEFLTVFAAEYLVYLSLLAVPYLWLRHKRRGLVRIVVSVIVALAIEEGLNLIFPVPRPFVAGNFAPLASIPVSEYYASFPSGHATFMAALGTGVFFSERIIGGVVWVLAVLTGVGRVAAGVHYPIDVLIGFLVGGATAILVKTALGRYSRKLPTNF